MNRSELSLIRNQQLVDFPELGQLEQWGKYCLLPLDIPRIESSKLTSWFFENAEAVRKVKEEKVVADVGGPPLFEAIDVTPTGRLTQPDAWDTNYRQDFLDLFPDVHEQIMEYFPFTSLDRLRIWSSIRRIPWHRDQTWFIDSPTSFRIMLYDDNPIQTLKVRTRVNSDYSLPRLTETNSYVWNNLRTEHGSNYVTKHRKILIILERYSIDFNRYHDLIKRSIDKYHDYAMIDQRKLADYVEL